MAYGTVSWFNADKGFGFLTPEDGGADVFVHISQVDGGGSLEPGQPVEYGVRQGDRGPQAEHVRVVADEPEPYAGGVLMQGTVSWYSRDKGFGFLVPDDVFMHGSAVPGGAERLVEGSRVEFEVVQGERGPQAEQVRPLAQQTAPAPPGPGGRTAGTVQWFNADKGFGFVTRDEGGPDVFVHVKAIADDGGALGEGDRVELDVVQGDRGPQAVDVRRLG